MSTSHRALGLLAVKTRRTRSSCVEALPEIGRRTAKDLVLLLQQAVALLQVAELRFFGKRQTVSDPVFDLGTLDPAVQAGLGDTEVLGDLRKRCLPAQGHGD